MDRRTCLGSIALSGILSLCGCLGDITDGGHEPDMSNGNSKDSNNGNHEMNLSIVDIDDGLDPLSFELDQISSILSEDDVPWIDIRVENTGNSTVSWLQAETDFAFPATSTTPLGLAIGSERKIEGMLKDEKGCNRVDGIPKDDISVETVIEPEEYLQDRYGIVTDSRNIDDLCPPPDTYRTEYTYDDLGTWGFDISLQHA